MGNVSSIYNRHWLLDYKSAYCIVDWRWSLVPRSEVFQQYNRTIYTKECMWCNVGAFFDWVNEVGVGCHVLYTVGADWKGWAEHIGTFMFVYIYMPVCILSVGDHSSKKRIKLRSLFHKHIHQHHTVSLLAAPKWTTTHCLSASCLHWKGYYSTQQPSFTYLLLFVYLHSYPVLYIWSWCNFTQILL